ncbi:hypothetical protein pEaSNUABM42_00081 [Erwinia phage pEa_SNUABM_42]|nr:hypothetical protein pEaSNUABM43_00081 [Erwinia phage pEa_SNUABM_43]QVW55398.1 hypothetical protein pEaSNUABM42_00081 [Erwinia phage pEa_SNUABM_42]
MNTLERMAAARKARISENNPHGYQSEQLRRSDAVLTRSINEGKKVDDALASAMDRLNKF